MNSAADIKTWLKRTNRDRAWLGGHLGVSKRTVDGWLSGGKPIPLAKDRLIDYLMDEDAKQERARERKAARGTPGNVLALDLTREELRAFSRAALAARMTLEEWMLHCLEQSALRAAEEGSRYKVGEEPRDDQAR